jgi:2-polyprenyl-6-hydroxyphenyl methylase/3-demethylubiquinone-9 3-methyltransferase
MTDAVDWHSRIATNFDAKYSHSPSFQERFQRWSELLRLYVNGASDVLDAGCGSGVFSEIAAKSARSVLGFDASAEMIAIANARKARAKLTNATFAVAPLGDQAVLGHRVFDIILCSSVLEYVDNYWVSFEWLAAALKPGGVILFSMPNGASLYRKAERLAHAATGRPAYYAYVKNTPRVGEVEAGLSRRGFKITSLQYYAPAPLLSPIARGVGRADLADNLFLIACERA